MPCRCEPQGASPRLDFAEPWGLSHKKLRIDNDQRTVELVLIATATDAGGDKPPPSHVLVSLKSGRVDPALRQGVLQCADAGLRHSRVIQPERFQQRELCEAFKPRIGNLCIAQSEAL